MEIDAIWRSELSDEVRHGRNRAAGRSDSFFDYEITLDFLFDFSHDLSFFLQLENDERVLDHSSSSIVADKLDLDLSIEQAYIQLRDVYWPGFDLQIGLQDVTYDFLSDGDAMMFEVSEANDPFQFGGVKASYQTDSFRGDFVWGMLQEHRKTAIDPILSAQSRDLAILHLEDYSDSGHWARFVEFSSIGLSDSERVYTVGSGFDYWPIPDIRFYAEGYLQWGRTPVDAMSAQDHRSHAVRAGIRMQKHKHPKQPYFDLSLWSFGGQDESPGSRSGNFVSLGDIDTTMLMEENDFGFGLRSNYQAVKGKAGFEIRKFHRLDVVAAWFQRDDTDFDAQLGTEIDVWYTRQFTPNVTFRYGMGWLFNANWFEEALDADRRASMFRFEVTLKF